MNAAVVENAAFWPLTLIVFLPALVAAFLSLPIVPDGSAYFSGLMIALSLIAVVYIGFVALMQKDMKSEDWLVRRIGTRLPCKG